MQVPSKVLDKLPEFHGEFDAPVHMILGSHSDADVVAEGYATLAGFGINPYVELLSAHRTGPELVAYAARIREARQYGTVMLTFAGMAAALGGNLCSMVTNPVIAVPISRGYDPHNSATGAQIALPPGPHSGLTIVGENQANEGAHAAVRTLTIGNPELAEMLYAKQDEASQTVIANNKALQTDGFKTWLQAML